MEKKSCTFIGEEIERLSFGYDYTDPKCIALKLALSEQIAEAYGSGVRRFYSVCEQGIDLWAAWVKLLREDKPLADSLRSVQGEDFAPVNEKINRLLCRFSEAVAVCDNIAAGKLKPPFENNTRIT